MLVFFLNAIKFLGFTLKMVVFNQNILLKLQIPLQNQRFWQL